MGQKWWDKRRKEAYARHNECCHACGIHQSKAKYKQLLEAHEAYEVKWYAGRAELKEIVALCHSCHNFIHRGRMEVMVSVGQMPESKMRDIITHGSKILIDNNIAPLQIPSVWAAWDRWCLVIDGVEHPGRFRSEDEWRDYYKWLKTHNRKDSASMLRKFKLECNLEHEDS